MSIEPAQHKYDSLASEIAKRLQATRRLMAERGFDALLVYGNNKVNGSIRYLTDYFPDRAGWISLSPSETSIVEGAAALVSSKSGTVLLVDPGLMPTRDIHVERIMGGAGFSARKGDGLSAQNIVKLLKDEGNVRRIGIETFDKFPAPLFLEMRDALPGVEFVRSTVVEELRLVKSPYDLAMIREAARSADAAHIAVAEILGRGKPIYELELIREAERVMRNRDPMYEDSCTGSPSLICSGTTYGGALLHLADAAKMINRGDIVHWDLALRYAGYPVDSSRTRSIGPMAAEHRRIYEVSLEIHAAVVAAAKPGIAAFDLVSLGERVAQKGGCTLWNSFMGHGLGWDIHERPDMGIEELPLAENMILAIEPRLAIDNRFLVGNEDMVQVTPAGGVSLTTFDRNNVELLV
jgi:Xaa-Pro aminopeptidase